MHPTSHVALDLAQRDPPPFGCCFNIADVAPRGGRGLRHVGRATVAVISRLPRYTRARSIPSDHRSANQAANREPLGAGGDHLQGGCQETLLPRGPHYTLPRTSRIALRPRCLTRVPRPCIGRRAGSHTERHARELDLHGGHGNQGKHRRRCCPEGGAMGGMGLPGRAAPGRPRRAARRGPLVGFHFHSPHAGAPSSARRFRENLKMSGRAARALVSDAQIDSMTIPARRTPPATIEEAAKICRLPLRPSSQLSIWIRLEHEYRARRCR